MAFINELVNSIGSGARNNKFRVMIPVGDNGQTFDILCTGASLVGNTIVPVDIICKGRKYQMRGEVSYDGSWNAEIYNTNNMSERDFLLSWMNEVHNHKVYREGLLGSLNIAGVNIGNALAGVSAGINQAVNLAKTNPLSLVGSVINGPGAYPPYMRNIRVQMLDNNDEKVISEVLLMGVFPKEVGAIDLTSEVGEVSKTTIVFAYSDVQYGSDLNNLIGDLLGTNVSSAVDKGKDSIESFN